MHKKARRGKEQAYLSGASCWRSSTLLLLRPGAAADLQIASCCCLLQIHTAWLEEKLDPLLCTRRREEEEAAAGGGSGGGRSSALSGQSVVAAGQKTLVVWAEDSRKGANNPRGCRASPPKQFVSRVAYQIWPIIKTGHKMG